MTLSIIIPTYKGKALLQKHLPQVLVAARKNDEIIIVDDASHDDTLDWLRDYFDLKSTESLYSDAVCYIGSKKSITVKVLINQRNLRFASSCNRGVATAKGEIIFLVNNDVSPEPDIFNFLLPHFEDKKVFAVGCKELAASEGDKAYGRSGGKFQRGFFVHFREPDQNQSETFWVSGGSGAFRKSMWDILSGFDPDYRPAYEEDIDLSWRAREKGWKILFEPKAVVHHVHESTNASVFGKRRMEIMSYKNMFIFVWKNARGTDLVWHFLWLPYHFVFTNIRSRGKFMQGFFMALKQKLFGVVYS